MLNNSSFNLEEYNPNIVAMEERLEKLKLLKEKD